MRPVHGTINLLRELLDLLLGGNVRRHDHLSARLEGKIGPADSFGEADRFKGVCARHYDEVWIAARFQSGVDLFKEGFELDRMLHAHVVMKPFRIDLILQVDAGGASVFKRPYSVSNMCGLTEPSPDVNNHGNIHYGRDGARRFCHIFQGEIRFHHTSGVAEGTTRQVEPSESDPLGNSGRNGIVDPRGSYYSRAVYHFP